mmetsp:Transcript_16402/g.45716  ORF Transcript_16402/g.45716 Transcript_16402/m.45716 type:complete len:424 (-) Transcript_16402:128-1399(-)|eukprot:CAMPEP_0117673096 /NCGR_PEP_ID=MMETSP0804-20121206/14284_1 /TAXON_ID=1074897 /ORGANISM="Tetraselmis astigmatica, Strain CCMP880" /LENGTH=423 /DNA_ID=CAMNT_0005481799 /DNA_START=68 /DNA_END=1339 /DNA_ORIENTATION=-
MTYARVALASRTLRPPRSLWPSVLSPPASAAKPLQALRPLHTQRDARVFASLDAAQAAEPATAEEGKPSQPQEPAAARKRRVLSGIQPTGSIHLGNYLGAIRNWLDLQDLYDTYFCVVDLHAITAAKGHDPQELREATLTVAAMYMACGLDPEKTSIFAQSHVRAHSELCWLLTCEAPMSWLNKMIQFKEKSRKAGEQVNAGLLTYPVLMAADILLYQADLVPVGEDQRQHLELTRDLAEKMNKAFGGKPWKKRGGRGGKIFKVPDAFIPPAGARVMSLEDGTSKMSKSDESDFSRICLLDSPDLIMQKIKRAKTDPFESFQFNNPERPECNNLLQIYQLVSGMSQEAVLAEVSGKRWGDFKPMLADAVIAHLEPIQQRYLEVRAESGYLEDVLAKGAEEAERTANWTLDNCRDAMGFVPYRR